MSTPIPEGKYLDMANGYRVHYHEAGPADGGSCALPRGTGWQCQDAEQPAVLQQPARVLGEVEAQRRIGRVGADQEQKGLPAGRPGRDPPRAREARWARGHRDALARRRRPAGGWRNPAQAL